jgi:hypothetical protein
VQPGLKVTILLPLPPSAGITRMSHHAWPFIMAVSFLLKNYIYLFIFAVLGIDRT